jgi:GntR family transcriptional regulator
MIFEEKQTISLQITEQFCWDIISGKLRENERMPSVRETAVELQVNPNTILKSYAELESRELIHKQRGLGYYVADGARKKILEKRKKDFFSNELPKVFKTLHALDITPDELNRHYNHFITETR